jgi:hypothetical protein
MKRLAQIALGLCLGVLTLEALAWWRDDGAFPHANFYVADEKLGVRLRPNATERFRLGKNPLSKISVNSAGLRGRELPEPSANEMLVLGDSQVFGLGVNDHETFSHVLSKLRMQPVVNAGVPTYGPLEYNALAAELIAQRKPKLVIYTVNMLNDLFENDRPNTERHRVWDGWAVRAETAPRGVFDFPGRSWLFSQSHAVYALRRYLHGATRDERSYASEGAWTDLIGVGEQRAHAITQRQADAQRTESEVAKLNEQIDDAARVVQVASGSNTAYFLREEIAREQNFATAHPGDIVRAGDAESSRPIVVTAKIIKAAVERRRAALETLAIVERESNVQLASAIRTRDDLKRRRNALLAKYRAPARPASVLSQRLRELRALCDASGCELLVIALPIDVQVSAQEWRKYGREPIDMSATTALADDLLSTANALGMHTLDALPALRKAEPGAFLDGDIHMTAKGHNALAWAIHRALRAPVPTRQPDPGLPAGRTYPPSLDDNLWLALDVPVENGEDTQCEARTQDEWIVLSCRFDVEYLLHPSFRSALPLAGGHGEVAVVPGSYEAHVLAPLLANDEIKIAFEWVRRGAAESQRLENATLIATRAKATDPPLLRFTERKRSPLRDEEVLTRSGPIQGYRGVYDPAYWPSCPPGSVNGNALGHCLPLCGPNRRCETGICEAWQGVDVCRSGP